MISTTNFRYHSLYTPYRAEIFIFMKSRVMFFNPLIPKKSTKNVFYPSSPSPPTMSDVEISIIMQSCVGSVLLCSLDHHERLPEINSTLPLSLVTPQGGVKFHFIWEIRMDVDSWVFLGG